MSRIDKIIPISIDLDPFEALLLSNITSQMTERLEAIFNNDRRNLGNTPEYTSNRG